MKYVNYKLAGRLVTLSSLAIFAVGCGSAPTQAPAAVAGAAVPGLGTGSCVPISQPIGFTVPTGAMYTGTSLVAGMIPMADRMFPGQQKGIAQLMPGGVAGAYNTGTKTDGSLSLNIVPTAGVVPGVYSATSTSVTVTGQIV